VSRRKSPQPSTDPAGDAAFEAAMLERWPRPEPLPLALRGVTLAFVFGFMGYAIMYRGATAGALLLPMAGEVAAGFLVSVLLAIFVVREEKFRREVTASLKFWGVVVALWFAWSWYQADRGELAIGDQVWRMAVAAFDYVRRNGMHWPMLAAALGLVAATASDVAAYRRKGPPFVYLGSLTLGLRLFVLIIAGFGFLVAADWSRRDRAFLMWGVLLVGELFALWAPFAAQQKIREEHAERAERANGRKAKAARRG
jgi:hypothetical protein